MKKITQSKLKERMQYDPESGNFLWKPLPGLTSYERYWNNRYEGAIAGCVNGDGYWQIRVEGRLYQAHQLIWMYVHGSWPEGQIDHINHIRSDNRIENLRDVSSHENSKNQRVARNNTSGITGVTWHKREQRWSANIRINGRQKCLGYYDDITEAVKARQEAERMYGFHENHGREVSCA